MGIIRVIFELFVLYLAYKLIFDFIIPVYNTTKQVSKQMGDIQSKMNQQQAAGEPGAAKEKASRPDREDYIEFEEIK